MINHIIILVNVDWKYHNGIIVNKSKKERAYKERQMKHICLIPSSLTEDIYCLL